MRNAPHDQWACAFLRSPLRRVGLTFGKQRETLRRTAETGVDGKARPSTPLRGRRRRVAGQLERALGEFRAIVVEAPTYGFETGLRIDLGGRIVQLKHLGRGNTGGDVVAWCRRAHPCCRRSCRPSGAVCLCRLSRRMDRHARPPGGLRPRDRGARAREVLQARAYRARRGAAGRNPRQQGERPRRAERRRLSARRGAAGDRPLRGTLVRSPATTPTTASSSTRHDESMPNAARRCRAPERSWQASSTTGATWM